MPLDPEEFAEDIKEETTLALLNLMNLIIKELSDEDRRVVPNNYTDPDLRGGIRPTQIVL